MARLVTLLAAGTAALAPSGHALLAQASGGGSGPLERIEAAADSGRVAEARRELARWLAGHGQAATPRDRAHASFLRGRLATDPDSAVDAYTRVAIGDQLPWAAEARLRLAQLRLARRQYDRALSDLATLRADFPGDSLAEGSWVWTGAALAGRGDTARACEAWSRAVAVGGEAAEAARMRRGAAGCPGASRAAVGTPRPGAATAAGATRAAASGTGPVWAVQLGAFSTRQAAEDLRDRVRRAGFQARVLEASAADSLYRVRSVRLERSSQADTLRARLQAAGFTAIIVEVGSGDEDGGAGP